MFLQKFSVLVLTGIILVSCSSNELKQPNIVLLFVDDLGHADLGYAQEKFITPNIDRLRSESVFFENARISVPTCSPSRGSLLTGKHAVDLQLFRHIPSGDKSNGFTEDGVATREYSYWKNDPAEMGSRNWLNLEEVTYAEALRDLGYYNAFFGKWHLGEEKYYPVHQGFDEQHFVTNWGAPTRYYPPYFKRWKDHPFPGDSTKTYLTDSITTEVARFIHEYDKENPFQLSVYYYNVHSPFHGKISWLEKYRSMGYEDKMANYAAMVSAMDESVGTILLALEEKGLEDETVVIFAGDQGGTFNNPPFSGGKMINTLYEGGTRVPLLIRYSDKLPVIDIETPVFTYDIFPTLVSIAGGEPGNYGDIDGSDLIPLISGDETGFKDRPVISYRSYENQYISLLDGKWKFVGYRDGTVELFDLEADIMETNNLADQYPEIVDSMIETVKAWEKEKGVFDYSGFK